MVYLYHLVMMASMMISQSSDVSDAVNFRQNIRKPRLPLFCSQNQPNFDTTIFLYFFIDTLTLKGDKELKDNSLYGVKMRCQNGVIWFCLTLGLSDDDFCEKF